MNTLFARKRSQGLTNQALCQRFTLLAMLLLALAGCAQVKSFLLSDDQGMIDGKLSVPVYEPGIFRSGELATQIDNYYRGNNPGPIGVTTFADLDNLYSTSTFGRILAEQLMSELSQRGYDVVELRHADALQFIAPSGEFALSRDITQVRRQRDLGGIVVGTYVASPKNMYVNARLINPSTSLILAAGSVEITRTGEISRLLRGGGTQVALERIPVRNLDPFMLRGDSRHMAWANEESDFSVEPRFGDASKRH